MLSRYVEKVSRCILVKSENIECDYKYKKVCSYKAQYPVNWTAQGASHFTPADLFIPAPTRLLWEAF